MKSAIHVGNEASARKDLPEITKAQMAILNSSAGDDVKKAALAALQSAYQIGPVSFHNVNIDTHADD